jgi:aromatic-L-amino-acid/L-tryptophan decarboxylase
MRIQAFWAGYKAAALRWACWPEMLAAGLNANVGRRDQIPLEVENQVTRWMRTLFGFPTTASGLLVTGASMANLLAVLISRDARLGPDVRQRGSHPAGGS